MLGRYRETVRHWSDPAGRWLFRLRLRPNHLTVIGLVVSLCAAAAFIEGRTRWAGALLALAGVCDLLDGALARVSGQVTAFGAFLDSVIDRYSDLVVLLAIVVLFARTPHLRGALVAMAGLVGSVMVSYTKARAESIGVECNVGMMERPERLICLVAGAVLGVLEPALWVLAILSNITALQRIVFTRRMIESGVLRAVLLTVLLLPAGALADEPAATSRLPGPETERAWARAIAAMQAGDPAPVVAELGEAALRSPIGDHLRLLVADAQARRGDLAAARATALGLVERHADSRLAARALLMAATLAARAGDEVGAQAILARLIDGYADAREVPEALYLLGQSAEAAGQRDSAVQSYRALMVLAPTTAWADAATDRLDALAAAGVTVPPLTIAQRLDRAERLLRGGVPKTAADEAERIADESRDPSIVVRALRVMADGAQRLGRYEAAAKALALAIPRVVPERQGPLKLEHARLLLRAGQRDRAFEALTRIAASGAEADAAEALWIRARALEDGQRPADAAAVYRALAMRYPKREVAGAALWRLGWNAYLKSDVVEAARHWARLADNGNRAYRLPALYWRARATAEGKTPGAAAPLFAQVIGEAPRSYYGSLALARAGRGATATGSSNVTLPADPTDAIANDPGFARVDLLRRLGLVESALEELEDVVERATGDTLRLYGFSSAYVRDERYHMALRIFRRHFANLAASGDPTLPRAFWEMLYPFGWRNDVLAAAQRSGIDPYLVAAVVREESSYYPRALSRAGARGLMQLMPATARPMAEHRGLVFAGGELLDDPGANLEIGTAFLAGLVREFKDARLALAAYNAGPARVRQWWQARRTSDLEAWVEQIPFDETRQYVKRVMFSWEEYRRVYGDPESAAANDKSATTD
ncbi:MAG TPA: transglycosylase SLT domain-containing protein [Methylomirabilota bacterium]|jgi:soluble lytic murein transglycosylase|nr:transglycosylase SLT domain-containing protein [Methylomirabilota bacterium]